MPTSIDNEIDLEIDQGQPGDADFPAVSFYAGEDISAYIEVPMVPPPGSYQATTPSPVVLNYNSGTGQTDTVVVHVRGIVELKGVTGGTGTGYMRQGGTIDVSNNNLFEIVVSNPSATILLNAAPSGVGSHVLAVDYFATIEIQDGATLTLSANPVDGARTILKGRMRFQLA